MSYFSELTLQYIAGEWRPGSGAWDIIDFDPYSGDKLAALTVATADEVDQAYWAADRAQPGWAAAGGYGRRPVFERVLRLIEEREQELTEAIILEAGGTHAKAAVELRLAKEFLREAVGLAMRPSDRILPSQTDGKENLVRRAPVGVVGVVSPFNYPFLLSVRSVAAALALGNAVVLKPHQNTPVTGGTLVGRLFEEAGLPPGVLNVVVTDIAEVGDALLEHPVPKVISFTGSDRTGRHVATVAAAHFKHAVLHLAGNSALIVLDDADLGPAVDAAVFSRFAHQGQNCMSANRILLQSGVRREFTEAFTERVRALRVGDPKDPRTQIGPLINTSQVEGVLAAVDQAVREGAVPLVRGEANGCLVEPSVLADVPADAEVLRQEVFGPVALLVPFDGVDDAVRIANDTPYGLSGAVHTGDVQRGVEIAKRVETGMFHVNGGTVNDEPVIPFGGEKRSGMGRLNGDAMVQAFTTQRWVSVQYGRSAFPF
ncbi:aldehyde dehydrogenase family protein [Streptomyces armeniacus]|uniref:Aldehyde dehydrogenase family protein n=1 Tax=Streptomyces armeniacus TaxID=83291 RepID=A0A345XRS7_9ACTN|nr:aldehyde dehydrogenase family protein [Streptomyces armeniacus]AXK34343.1 aldehyde dehydrogenase family protein [Streptomyces armeniacus]